MWWGKNSFFQLSQPRAELAMVCPPNHSTDRHLAFPPVSSALTLRHALLTAGLSICSSNLPWPWPQLTWDPHSRASGQRNGTEHQKWHATGTNEGGRGISDSTNHFPFVPQMFGLTSCFQKADPSMGAWEMQDVCLALQIQPKELQRCIWGLDAMAVPTHTQSKSRDKYESEKEKNLWNFVQVLSTSTHAEKLYLSKPSHWLHEERSLDLVPALCMLWYKANSC